MLQGERYDGLAADMWGVGVTVLEIICGSRTVDKALGLGEEAGHPAMGMLATQAKGYRKPDESFVNRVLEGRGPSKCL